MKTIFHVFIFNLLFFTIAQAQDAAMLQGEWTNPNAPTQTDFQDMDRLMREALEKVMNNTDTSLTAEDILAQVAQRVKGDNNSEIKLSRMVFMNDGTVILALEMELVLANYKLDGKNLEIKLHPSFGDETINFEVQKIDAQRMELIPIHPEGSGERDKRPAVFNKTTNTATAATREDMMGAWYRSMPHMDDEQTVVPDYLMVVIMLEKDSASIFDLKGYRFPWWLSPDGHFLMIKLSDDPSVSIMGAAPGMMIFELKKENDTWYAESQDNPKVEHKVCAPGSDDELKKQIIGSWQIKVERGNMTLLCQIEENGTFSFGPSKKSKKMPTMSDLWTLLPCTKMIQLMGDGKIMSVDVSNGKLILDGMTFERVSAKKKK